MATPAFTLTSGIGTLIQFIGGTMKNATSETLEKLRQTRSPIMNSSSEGFLAKLFQSPETEEGFLTPEVHSSLKSCGLLNKSGHRIYYLRTSRGYYHMTKARRLTPCSERWMNWGTMHNGKCLTANIGYPKTGSGYSLSDILEDSPDPKYFLSEKAMEAVAKARFGKPKIFREP